MLQLDSHMPLRNSGRCTCSLGAKGILKASWTTWCKQRAYQLCEKPCLEQGWGKGVGVGLAVPLGTLQRVQKLVQKVPLQLREM